MIQHSPRAGSSKEAFGVVSQRGRHSRQRQTTAGVSKTNENMKGLTERWTALGINWLLSHHNETWVFDPVFERNPLQIQSKLTPDQFRLTETSATLAGSVEKLLTMAGQVGSSARPPLLSSIWQSSNFSPAAALLAYVMLMHAFLASVPWQSLPSLGPSQAADLKAAEVDAYGSYYSPMAVLVEPHGYRLQEHFVTTKGTLQQKV